MSHFLDHDSQHTPPPSDFRRLTSHLVLIKIPRDDEFTSTSMMMQIKNNASTLGALKKQIVDLVSHFRAFLVTDPDRCL